jgi:hypothetical protein
MKKIFSLALIMSVLICCKKDNSKILTIDVVQNIQKTIKLSKISKNLKIMVINNYDFQLIGKVKKIQKLNSNLIVQSPSMLSVINSKGDVIKQLRVESNEVRSPLKGINEMQVYDGMIYVLDREIFKIHIFDQNLNLKSSIDLKFYCQSFGIINSETFIFYL